MKKPAIIFLISILTATAIYARPIGGINMPDTLKAEKETLVLNGAGIRNKFFVDVYVSGLYLKAKNSNAQAILNADEAMAVRLHITSSIINGERMAKATNEGFVKSTNGNTAPLRTRIDQFIAVFNSGIKVNDVYDIIYIPGEGIKVYKNGAYKSTTKGLDMKKALFGIWIGAKPPQADMKKAMLGL
ncbi:MAG: chalcone isomerase [Spirochaetae bacterium HGW-Spirochaetae-1]|jgi:hypothetical protein|nr:MAG: chalcone isomerase [Spirochaetae bacterium HGW-Spirochaetae-1]